MHHKLALTTAADVLAETLLVQQDHLMGLLRKLRGIVEASPHRQRTVEECCEMLVMLTCGQEISLLVDRDPWRWKHTPEELHTVESAFAEELQALRSLTHAMSEVMGAEIAAEKLLSVFVEGAV